MTEETPNAAPQDAQDEPQPETGTSIHTPHRRRGSHRAA